MNLNEYLYTLMCKDLNFILLLIVNIVISVFRFYQLFNVFYFSIKYFNNDFWKVKSKY